jgi:hypothetical protein
MSCSISACRVQRAACITALSLQRCGGTERLWFCGTSGLSTGGAPRGYRYRSDPGGRHPNARCAAPDGPADLRADSAAVPAGVPCPARGHATPVHGRCARTATVPSAVRRHPPDRTRSSCGRRCRSGGRATPDRVARPRPDSAAVPVAGWKGRASSAWSERRDRWGSRRELAHRCEACRLCTCLRCFRCGISGAPRLMMPLRACAVVSPCEDGYGILPPASERRPAAGI